MFDQSTITDIKTPVWDGSALHLEWISTAPAGTIFQVYVAQALAWQGTSRWVAIPMPSTRVRIDIGAVGPGEGTTDFSAQLPPAFSDRARLSWIGGTYLDATGNNDVVAFRVYGESSPGSGIDYGQSLAELNAYPGGIVTDGYGLGGFGQGGYGRASSSYHWTSPPLASGTWAFAIVSTDTAGNMGAPVVSTVAISTPPRPPASFPDGSRLDYSYDSSTRRLSLKWQASPG
jgi:hypothetical protein